MGGAAVAEPEEGHHPGGLLVLASHVLNLPLGEADRVWRQRESFGVDGR